MSNSDSDAGGEENQKSLPAHLLHQVVEEPPVEELIGIGAPSMESGELSAVAAGGPQEFNTLDSSGQHDSSSLMLMNAKRLREQDTDDNDDGANAPVDDYVLKRQKAAANGESMIDKLKMETEQLIENPEQTLGPGLVPPGDEGITTFHDNDVLSGRGGGTNVHPGNRNFRDLINMHRRLYLKARKNDKPAISRAIVRSIRNNDGRFLRKDDKSGLWYEIGDDAAREKTSQALRQRAPEMRKILFDTEREEARVATEHHMRHHQMIAATVMPMASMAPAAIHPGMMAYAPGAMAPMMFVNPAMFMQQQQQQQHGVKPNSYGATTAAQPTMQPMMMMDQYQQAAMFQFMANPMMMNSFMPSFPQPAQQSTAATQHANGGGKSQADSSAINSDSTEVNNAESRGLQEDKRDSFGSENNSVPDQAMMNITSTTEDSQADDTSGNDNARAS